MDIAAMSVVMANHQVKSAASLAVMGNIKKFAEQQGQQLVEMLQSADAPHPTHGKSVDIQI